MQKHLEREFEQEKWAMKLKDAREELKEVDRAAIRETEFWTDFEQEIYHQVEKFCQNVFITDLLYGIKIVSIREIYNGRQLELEVELTMKRYGQLIGVYDIKIDSAA